MMILKHSISIAMLVGVNTFKANATEKNTNCHSKTGYFLHNFLAEMHPLYERLSTPSLLELCIPREQLKENKKLGAFMHLRSENGPTDWIPLVRVQFDVAYNSLAEHETRCVAALQKATRSNTNPVAS